MASFKNTAKSSDFKHAAALAKKRGATFDGTTWQIDDAAADKLRLYPEYFTEVTTGRSIFVTDKNGNVDLVS